MNWSERQARFARALSDPALPAPDIFTPCDAETRFNVYRNNVAAARIEALKAQFPVVCSFVGDEFFTGMARAFMQAHPARSPLLSEYGAELADFIGEFAPASGLPCLADMARLEWLCLQALGAADRPAFSLQQLAATEPAALLDARAEFHPAFRFLSSLHPIVAIWSALQEDRLASIQHGSPESAMVVRPAPSSSCAPARRAPPPLSPLPPMAPRCATRRRPAPLPMGRSILARRWSNSSPSARSPLFTRVKKAKAKHDPYRQ
jgi:hypothetical protein